VLPVRKFASLPRRERVTWGLVKERLNSQFFSLLLAAATAACWASPRAAEAGMPAPFVLTDVARMRVETISFFLLVLLVTSASFKCYGTDCGPAFSGSPGSRTAGPLL
jgi:hypothetical protein